MSVPVSCTGMDFITLENKEKILGHKAARPAENIFFNPAREQPLFWAERKSTNLWIALLKDLKIKTGVFDLSCGSGMLAKACIRSTNNRDEELLVYLA